MAEQLCCPEGTVLSRLSRARERLRLRLLHRGVTLSVGLFTAVIAANGQAAEMTAGLVTESLKVALTFAAGNAVAAVASARATALTEGALRAMFISKMKVALGIVVTVGLVGAGAGLISNALLADPPGTHDQDSQFLRPAAVVEDPAPAAEKKAEPDNATNAALRLLQSRRKLQQIGIALHNYADSYESCLRQLSMKATQVGYYRGHPLEPRLGWAPVVALRRPVICRLAVGLLAVHRRVLAMAPLVRYRPLAGPRNHC
jgi:hypothetical protein